MVERAAAVVGELPGVGDRGGTRNGIGVLSSILGDIRAQRARVAAR